MSGHTKGSWKVEPREVFGRGDNPGSGEIVIWDEDGEGYTVIVRDLDCSDEESMANARLIAAAPELLEALEGLLAIMRRPPTGTGGWHEFDTKKADTAIAKARGEA